MLRRPEEGVRRPASAAVLRPWVETAPEVEEGRCLPGLVGTPEVGVAQVRRGKGGQARWDAVEPVPKVRVERPGPAELERVRPPGSPRLEVAVRARRAAARTGPPGAGRVRAVAARQAAAEAGWAETQVVALLVVVRAAAG